MKTAIKSNYKKIPFLMALGFILAANTTGCQKPDTPAVTPRQNAPVIASEIPSSQSGSTGFSSAEPLSEDTIADITINSMTVAFFTHYNYSSGKAINECDDIKVPEYIMNLDDDQIAQVQEALSKAEVIPKNDPMCNCDHLALDYYYITINDSVSFYSDNEKYIWGESLSEMYTAAEFVEIVAELAGNYAQEHAYITPFADGITSIVHENQNIEVTEAIVNTLKNCTMSTVEIDSTYDAYGEIEDIIVLKNNCVLTLFKDNNVFGYIKGNGYDCFVIMDNVNGLSILDYLANIYENKENSLGPVNNNAKVTICYENNTFDISKELADEILTQASSMAYNHYDWLSRDYDMGDCVIIDIENGQFYIPVEIGMGNRYYVAPNGDIYLINNFKNKVETQIFELVGVER